MKIFSFFKSNKENKLEKLGYHSLIKSYKAKVRNKEWTKKDYQSAVQDLMDEKKIAVENFENNNVSTRQSFATNDVLVPLNLENIQNEYIDYDYVYSSLMFEFKTKKRVHPKALQQLEARLDQMFPALEISVELQESVSSLDVATLINKANVLPNDINKHELKAVYNALRQRLS